MHAFIYNFCFIFFNSSIYFYNPLLFDSCSSKCIVALFCKHSLSHTTNNMKKLTLLLNIALLTIGLQVAAQTAIPKGFEKASIVLTDGSTLEGYAKDQMRKQASIQFFNPTTGKKTSYDANNLNSISINDNKWICLQGDFFKQLNNSQPILLQKCSDVSGKPMFNGVETVISTGSQGKIDDQFQYDSNTNQLIPVSNKKG